MWVLRMKVVINQEKKIIVYSKERRKYPNCGVGELNKLFLQLYKEELAITKNKLFTLLVEKKQTVEEYYWGTKRAFACCIQHLL